MQVRMLQNVQVLGTSIRLAEGKTYKASPADNQPGYKEKGLIFVEDPKSRDSVLCTLGDECERIK
jgi:hypothetical protein